MKPPFGTVRQLLDAGDVHVRKRTWARLVALAVFLGFMESAGALLLYGFLGAATNPRAELGAPVSWFGLHDRRTALVVGSVMIAAFFTFRAAALVVQSMAQQKTIQGVGVQLVSRLV